VNQPLPVEITVWALAAVGVGYLVAILVGLARGAGNRPQAGLVRKLVGAVFVGLIGFALLGSIAVLALLLLSGLLIEAGAPGVVYLFTGAAAAFLLWRGIAHTSYGMEGCTKSIMLCWGAYGLSWSAVSLWLTPETAPAAWSIGAFVRPFVVAAPPALLAWRLTRDRRKLVQVLGIFVTLAALAALVFFPVENGLAQDRLPPSDWLRFPLVGMIVVVGLVLLPQLAQVFAARRSPSASRRKAVRRDAVRALGLAAVFGALLGLLWAVTRAIETVI
jgi:hypothetical protein